MYYEKHVTSGALLLKNGRTKLKNVLELPFWFSGPSRAYRAHAWIFSILDSEAGELQGWRKADLARSCFERKRKKERNQNGSVLLIYHYYGKFVKVFLVTKQGRIMTMNGITGCWPKNKSSKALKAYDCQDGSVASGHYCAAWISKFKSHAHK